jgi:OOP family OmpA-OmpF porin
MRGTAHTLKSPSLHGYREAKMNTRHAVVGGVLALAAALASAQTVYLGASGGSTRSNVDCSGTISCDKSDSGWKAYAGYNINPLWGVEVLGYGMGTIRGSVGFPGIGVVNADFRTTGFGVAGAVNVPLGSRVDLIARLGVGSNRLKVNLTSGSLSGSDSETSAHLLWGVGVGFKVTPNLSIRTEIDGTSATYAGERFDSTLISAGLSVKF